MLPAQRIGPDGRPHVDFRAIGALAFPLMLNSGLQVIISLTDTWFVGHISTTAMAGLAAIYWVVLFFVMVFGGIGLAVQTIVAQAEGSRRRWRAGHATWVALWGALITVPFFAGFAWVGGAILAPFGLDADVQQQAVAFWWPRMMGAPIGVALWAILGFFNGISRPRITVMTSTLVAVVNAVLNEVFIFRLDVGHRRLRVGHECEHALRRRVRAVRVPPGRPAPHAQDPPDLASRRGQPAAPVQDRPADGDDVRR